MSQEIVIEYCSFESLKIEPNSGRKEYNIASVGKRRHSDLTCPSRIRVTLYPKPGLPRLNLYLLMAFRRLWKA